MTDTVTFTEGANATLPAGTAPVVDIVDGDLHPTTKITVGVEDDFEGYVGSSLGLPIRPATGIVFVVSNGGTFAVQVDAALPPGDNDIGNVDIVDDVSGSFDHGAKSDISTSAAQLTAASIPAKRGVQLLAGFSNTAVVCIGNSDVTFTGTADATDGFPLQAGDGFLVPVDNVNKVYVISNDINQRIEWAAV